MFLPRALHGRYVVGAQLPPLGVSQRFAATRIGQERVSLRLELADLAAAGLTDAQQAQLAAQARRGLTAVHPHVARALEAGVESAVQWTVEAGEGLSPLATYLREHADLAGKVRLVLDLWEGLGYLHGRGFRHGCLCPGTLWVGPHGGVIGGLCSVGAISQVAGRSAVLPETGARSGEGGADPKASRRRDVHDLAQALLWLHEWPEWLEDFLRGVQAQPVPAEEVARTLQAAARQRLGDAGAMTSRAGASPGLAPSSRSDDAALTAGAGVAEVTRTLARGVVSVAVTCAALLAAVALGTLAALGPAPELRTVPNVEGMAYGDAEKRLQESQLTLKVANHDFNGSVAEGGIIRTDPYPGKLVRAGREVRATVSRGRREAKVPGLAGLSLTAAEERLTALDLAAGEVRRKASPKDQDLVIGQNPSAGKVLPRDGKVDLVVSGGQDFGALNVGDGAKYLFRTLTVTVPQGKPLQLVTVDVRGGGMDRSFQESLSRPGETLKVDLYGPAGARVRVKIEDERVYSERL